MKILKLISLGTILLVILFPPVEWEAKYRGTRLNNTYYHTPYINHVFILNINSTEWKKSGDWKYFLYPNIQYGRLLLYLSIIGMGYLFGVQILKNKSSLKEFWAEFSIPKVKTHFMKLFQKND
ncbi:MAG: hypothetical protein L6Q47_06395 [Ignavibacteriaceae bacterium]|nr:hypothetical protein [Ignavibacteriaceae bacterium]